MENYKIYVYHTPGSDNVFFLQFKHKKQMKRKLHYMQMNKKIKCACCGIGLMRSQLEFKSSVKPNQFAVILQQI